MSALTDATSDVETHIKTLLKGKTFHPGFEWTCNLRVIAERHPRHISEAVSIVVQKLRREGVHATKVGLDICVKGGE